MANRARDRIRKWALVGALAASALVMSAATAGAAEPAMGMTRDQDGHMRGPAADRLAPQWIPPRTKNTHSTRVYDFDRSIDKVARIDHRLSHLCQRGAFIQQMDGFYWANTPGRRLGVAFSGGANLDDPQGKRQRGEVYFFQDQDSRCRVYVALQAAVMADFTDPASQMRFRAPSGIPAGGSRSPTAKAPIQTNALSQGGQPSR